MTIRQTILQNLIELLSGINGQPPYQSKVDSVYDYDIAPFENLSDDVMLGIFPQAYNPPLGLTRVTPRWGRGSTLMIGVRGVIRSSAELAGILKSNLIDDIGIVLYSNINLGIQTNAVYHDGINFTQEYIIPS